uniref:Cytochrome c oxidase subunit 3 n=1 Tax=Stereobalanus canadensis TaxID=560612 RepID=A0A3Q8HNH4_9BILA|nr:cytochrome c oxidase subunit III [Stereobalanus canadensis]AXY64127.1 cytochrome c oxidase subunit 3 [Stereobalanus canadensis]
MTHQHPYHLVDQSPWPLAGATSALLMTTGIFVWFHYHNPYLVLMGLMMFIITSFQWWRDVSRESTMQGAHTSPVVNGLRWGMILFIVSEVCFFAAFFWTFFHSSLSPSMQMGSCWPPTGVTPLNPFEVPLLNTAMLLSSGVSMTWAHHSLLESNRKQAIQALSITVLLGLYFTALQVFEYMQTPFTIADSAYGSTFFVATGFHGLHVMIGTTFLIICLMRLFLFHFSNKHHFGFEASAWYWHFVDVVWLFLFMTIYWWGS